jgi:hypothetical protein
MDKNRQILNVLCLRIKKLKPEQLKSDGSTDRVAET